MTHSAFILKIGKQLEKIKEGHAMALAVSDTHAKMTERIFEQGKKADGSDIGEYGGGEIYVNPLLSPKKFAPAGKEGNTKFSNGQPHKTGYFENYKAYKEKIGLKTDKVNLVLSRRLQSDFSNGLIKKDELTWAASAKNQRNRNIIDGADTKYGKVFTLTVDEVFNFRDAFTFELLQGIKNA